MGEQHMRLVCLWRASLTCQKHHAPQVLDNLAPPPPHHGQHPRVAPDGHSRHRCNHRGCCRDLDPAPSRLADLGRFGGSLGFEDSVSLPASIIGAPHSLEARLGGRRRRGKSGVGRRPDGGGRRRNTAGEDIW